MGCCALQRVYIGRKEILSASTASRIKQYIADGQHSPRDLDVDADLIYCIVCTRSRPPGHPARQFMSCCPKLVCRWCLLEWIEQRKRMNETIVPCPGCRTDTALNTGYRFTRKAQLKRTWSPEPMSRQLVGVNSEVSEVSEAESVGSGNLIDSVSMIDNFATPWLGVDHTSSSSSLTLPDSPSLSSLASLSCPTHPPTSPVLHYQSAGSS